MTEQLSIQEAEAQVTALQKDLREAQRRLEQGQSQLHRLRTQEQERMRNPRLDLGISSDYAVLTCGRRRYYYGYEVVDADGEWCFQATGGGKDVIIPRPQLMAAAGLDTWDDPERFLLAGIGLLMLTGDE
jgi:hypothetical protein